MNNFHDLIKNAGVLLFVLLLSFGCNKESIDYRTKYCGNYTFYSVCSAVQHTNGAVEWHRDTLLYTGTITTSSQNKVHIKFREDAFCYPASNEFDADITESGELSNNFDHNHVGLNNAHYINTGAVTFDYYYGPGMGGYVIYYVQGTRLK